MKQQIMVCASGPYIQRPYPHRMGWADSNVEQILKILLSPIDNQFASLEEESSDSELGSADEDGEDVQGDEGDADM